jgi:RNA polymerase sigma-70 factor (ECF subfamily)
MVSIRKPSDLQTRLRPAPGTEEQGARERAIGLGLQRGDPAAASALWDHFAPLVRGLLVRALGPDHEVEDAMQEVFLRALHRGRALREPTLLRSYVVAITIHHIRSQFRHRRVRRAFAELWVHRQRDATPPSLDPAPVLAVRALYRALERLPTEERLAFSLRFIEGSEINAAATLLGTSPATFKRRLGRAKQRLWALTGEDPVLAPYLGGDRASLDDGAVAEPDGLPQIHGAGREGRG